MTEVVAQFRTDEDIDTDDLADLLEIMHKHWKPSGEACFYLDESVTEWEISEDDDLIYDPR